jgi:hypothetical protein
MGYVSFVTLEAACKLCVGIYLSSALLFAGACVLWATARGRTRESGSSPAEREDSPTPWTKLAAALGIGILFVAVPTVIYAAAAPDFTRYAGTCGSLSRMADPQQALVPLGPQDRSIAMIEVIDPLCDSCGAFERRFSASPLSAEVSRRILLFPLDKTCNWMIGESVHPGACAVSEAVLCAGERAAEVLDWAFEERATIAEKARGDPDAADRMLSRRFPELGSCMGSARARARLNQALRWAVKNRLQVLTPQVYVNGLRLCDEDTDLGLEYSLPRLMARAGSPPAGKREPVDRKAGIRRPDKRVDEPRPPRARPESEQAEPPSALPSPGVDSDTRDAAAAAEIAQPSPGVEADEKGGAVAAAARDGAVEPAEPEVAP